MASASANDIIQRALVKARVIYPGEPIPSGKASQVYDELNDMMELWVIQKLLVLYDTLESFTLTAGTGTYTYGSGGNFDSARPIEIKDECFVRSDNSDYPVHLKTIDVYRRVSDKSLQSRPRILAYNPEFPLGKVFLSPVPDSAWVLHLAVVKQVTSFSDRTTSVSLAPGYRGGIVANLALKLCSSFGKKATKELAKEASDFVRAIKATNVVPTTPMRTPHLTAMVRKKAGGTIMEGPFG